MEVSVRLKFSFTLYNTTLHNLAHIIQAHLNIFAIT